MYAWAQDRLARGTIATSMFTKAIEESGAEVRLVQGGWDSDTAEIMGAISGYELRRIKQRMMLGKQGRIKKGLHIGEPPFGYRVVRNADGESIGYELIPSEHTILKRIAQLYLKRYTIRDIASSLGTHPRTHKPWLGSTVHYIIANPFYRGIVAYGELRAAAAHPPAWDAQSCLKIEAEMKRRREMFKRGPRRTKHFHLFAGVARCGICGRPLASIASSTQSGNIYLGYRCNTRQYFQYLTNFPDHEPNHISERKIISLLQDVLNNKSDKSVIEILSVMKGPVSETERRVQAKRELAELEQQAAELRAGLEAVRNVPSAAATIQSELKRVQHLVDELRVDLETPGVQEINVAKVLGTIKKLRSALAEIDTVSNEMLKRIITEAIPALYIKHGRIVPGPKLMR